MDHPLNSLTSVQAGFLLVLKTFGITITNTCEQRYPIDHEGRYFRVPDAYASAPPLRRGLLAFQAGIARCGREFAGRNADVVFLGCNHPMPIHASVEVSQARAVALDLTTSARASA